MSTLKIFIYKTSTGKSSFIEWRDELDPSTRAIVRTRISRMILGNFGDCKIIQDSDGIWELRIDYGPGYRIHFGKKDLYNIILLTGGDKKKPKS